MKKDNNLTAVLVVNAIILVLIAYKPFLDKLTKHYIKLNQDPKQKKSPKDHQMEISQMLEETKESIETLVEKLSIDQNDKTDIYHNLFHAFEIVGTNQVEYSVPTSLIAQFNSVMEIPTSIPIEELSDNIVSFPKTKLFRNLFATITLAVAFYSWSTLNTKDAEDYFAPSIIKDFEDILGAKEDNLALNDTEKTIPYTIEQKIEAILLSNRTNEEKWNYLFTVKEMTINEAMYRIIQSGRSEEVLTFITKTNHLTVEQKIWYALLLPNISLEEVLNHLFTMEGISQTQIIKETIDYDMVSFQTLFDTILKIEDISKAQLLEYFTLYHTDYHKIPLDEMVQYVLHMECLQEEKVEYIWALLNKNSVNEKVQFILDFYQITYEDYLHLYNIDSEKWDENQYMIMNLFEKVNQEKEEYILTHYDFKSKEELDIVISGVAAEGCNHYADLYYVSNTIFNRITHPTYVKKGINPYLQFIAKEQFAVYDSGSYLFYLYPRNFMYANKYAVARQAFYDMFYAGYEGVVHNYTEFRSWDTVSFSNTYVVVGGNRYGNPMDESIRIIYQNLLDYEIDHKESHTFVKCFE